MHLGLGGRVAIVAGSSRGLGRAIAEGLAAEGARVVICSRTPDAVARAAAAINGLDACRASGGEAVPVVADVSRPDDIDRLVGPALDRWGRIDILVTNAGGPPSGPVASLTDAQWTLAVETLLLSVVRLSRAVIPTMQKQRWGRILHVASFTVKQPLSNLALSNAVRLAVVGLAKTQTVELAPYNILVNTLCPGPIATDRLNELTQQYAKREGTSFEDAKQRLWLSQIPLGRLGEPREFADLAVFLASDRASFLTGGTYQVDGGAVRGPF
ncbi:MAG: SDR family oxidoreductase [Armatimonadetes bacterium]|nr:SDR family oxidoreductase [Armatimonadota bacterium]